MSVLSSIPSIVEKVVKEIWNLKRPAAPGTLALPRSIEYKMQVGNETRVYDLPLAEYAYAMYQSLITFSEVNKQHFSEIALVFLMAGLPPLQELCNVRLTTAFVEAEGKKAKTPQVTIDAPDFAEIYHLPNQTKDAAEMLELFIDECPSQVTAVTLTFRGEKSAHRNLLIALKLNPENTLVFLYEPHGSNRYGNLFAAHHRMIEQVVQKMSPMYKLISMYKSCPVGLQLKSKDKIGYCVIYSLLFLYCFLRALPKLSKLQSNKEFETDLEMIERGVLRVVPQRDMQNLVTKFAILFCETFWENYSPTEIELEKYETQLKAVIAESKFKWTKAASSQEEKTADPSQTQPVPPPSLRRSQRARKPIRGSMDQGQPRQPSRKSESGPKACPAKHSRNPETNRCRKDCEAAQIRNPKTKRCVKYIRKGK